MHTTRCSVTPEQWQGQVVNFLLIRISSNSNGYQNLRSQIIHHRVGLTSLVLLCLLSRWVKAQQFTMIPFVNTPQLRAIRISWPGSTKEQSNQKDIFFSTQHWWWSHLPTSVVAEGAPIEQFDVPPATSRIRDRFIRSWHQATLINCLRHFWMQTSRSQMNRHFFAIFSSQSHDWQKLISHVCSAIFLYINNVSIHHKPPRK